ncbi:IclR family transcriptional regulator [Paenibacillus chungangensis]|uniref:IclR family transcriptional regulator n=1 Tax=Paenibacillus chungangensis TaxID=696535 RepID=A0ABW3HNZ1_9BACL
MDRINKYNVPALERAHLIIGLIAEAPSGCKLIDLSRELGINKSSMYSLLLTMERLGWLQKDARDCYRLGSFFGRTGSLYFRQYDLVSHFYREAGQVRDRMEETLQLGKLEGRDVFYLAKEEASSPVRLVSEPGTTWAAYATGLGKVMLADKSDQEVIQLYPEERLSSFTDHTIGSLDKLLAELAKIRLDGYAIDEEEAVLGFSCAAAPIIGANGSVVAAVSCSVPQSRWARKKQLAIEEVTALAQVLSHGQ